MGMIGTNEDDGSSRKEDNGQGGRRADGAAIEIKASMGQRMSSE